MSVPGETFKIKTTPHPKWAYKLWSDLTPLKDNIVNHEVFAKFTTCSTPVEAVRRALIAFYPLVENFPNYMRLNLQKAGGGSIAKTMARAWLEENIRVEKEHADWWILWGLGFGCKKSDFNKIHLSPEADAINHYLWDINIRGSLLEGIAATNLAIEWPTGEWSKKAQCGIRLYANRKLICLTSDVEKWASAHAAHDDEHPYEAMELIKLLARTTDERQKAFDAGKRGMEYYLMALDACLKNR